MRNTFYILAIVLSMSACDIINPDEDPVAFIRVNDFPLETNLGPEGAASENIRDVWLNVDGELIGSFEFPVDIPVLKSGPVNVNAFAGILDNGLSSSHRRYPFYDIYDVDVTLVDEQVTEIFPVAMYVQDALLFFMEDFESGGFQFEASIGSDTTFVDTLNADPTDLLRGDSYGAIVLEGERNHFKVESTMDLDLALHSIVYLELDYKCEHPFVVGLKRTQPTFSELSLFGFNPVFDSNGEPAWNKIYVNLNDGIDALQNGSGYEFFLEGSVDEGTETTFCFDNFKVIHPD